eukprot:6491358-Amphidinium_carterae.2
MHHKTHIADKCWWKGPTYNIDQPTSIWSLPNDTSTQRQQQMTHHSSASTTLLSDYCHKLRTDWINCKCTRLDHFKQLLTASINATLTVDQQYTDQTQVQQWAIFIDTGAMTSVASKDHFTNIPLKSL